MDSKDKLIVKLDSGQELIIKVDLFSEGYEIDVEDLIQIDYSNLAADIATFPVIMNRFGLLLTDMENKISEAELNLRTWQAKIKMELRNEMMSNSKEKLKPTNDVIDDKMRMKPMYKILYMKLHKAVKQKGYISNIYWSCKAKVDNLNKLSLTIQPGDIDLDNMVDSINGIRLRTFKKMIK